MKPLSIRMINIEFPPLLGGAQMHILRLCRYLSTNGVNVEVITRHYAGLPYEETMDGFVVHRTPLLHSSRAGASISFMFFALKQLIAMRDQYQILHAHEMISPMTIGLLAKELPGKRLVINPHSGGYMGDMYKLKNRRKLSGQWRLAWARRRGDAFIAISQQIAAELKAEGFAPEKIHAIPTALDTHLFTPVDSARKAALREQLGLGSGMFACYTGRLAEIKGVDTLIRVWARVAADAPTATLLIVGDGEQRASLENLAKQLRVAQQVRFIGAVKDTSPYLQASDLYVQSSLAEGMPVALMEAMACGLPCLATAVGGVNDLINSQSNGLTVLVNDEEGLRARLLELIADAGLRQRLGEQAYCNVSNQYSIEKIGQAHLNLYSNLAASL